MCTSVRHLFTEFIGVWIYLTLGGLGTLHTPYLPSITWGLSLTVGLLVGGSESHLNPAVTLGLSSIGKCSISSFPGRIIGQFTGALVSAITLVGIAPSQVVQTMIEDKNNTLLEWAEPWLTLPQYSSTLYLDILAFTLTAVMFQMMFISSQGSALYQGISLTVLTLVLGPQIGAGLNPAREIMGRLLVSFYHQNWEIFLYYDIWAWIPLVWSVAGCITGSLLYWLFIQVPRNVDTKENKEDTDAHDEEEGDYTSINSVMQEKPPQVITEKPPQLVTYKTPQLTAVKPPVPPPTPPQPLINSASSTPESLRTLFKEDSNITPSRRNSAIKKYCKKNNISNEELDRVLRRYREVSIDNLDLGNGVTVKVGDDEKEEK